MIRSSGRGCDTVRCSRDRPVLTADPDLEVRTDLPALLHAHPHELPDALAVQRLERVKRQDASFHEIEEELAFRVVPAISERGLREIVRPEGEELRMLRNFIRGEGG